MRLQFSCQCGPWHNPGFGANPLSGVRLITDTTSVNVNISQLELLSRLLDVTSLRHHVIAHNIANVNAPGFHRMDVSFEESLEKQLANNGQPAVGQLKPR